MSKAIKQPSKLEGIGEVKVSGTAIPRGECEKLAAELDVGSGKQMPVNDAANQRRSGRGRFRKKQGRKPMAALPRGVRGGNWDFKRSLALVPIERSVQLDAAAFRVLLETDILRAYAGTKPGIITWSRAQTAIKWHILSLMCAQKLRDTPDLKFHEWMALWREYCNASERRDDILEKIGLEKLSELPEEIDPWMVQPSIPAQLPADVISPPADSAKEIVEGFKEVNGDEHA